MIQISVILENTSISKQYKKIHGLSLCIKTPEQYILLDTGPDSKFYVNAIKKGIDLSQIDTLVLSHAHYDHTGGVNKFCKINSKAQVLLFNPQNKKFLSKANHLYIDIGFHPTKKTLSRVSFLSTPTQISTNWWFIPCTIHYYGTSIKNKSLYIKQNGKIENDNFNHEGILVYDDNGKLSIFNSCSHNGIINTIESVRGFFPKKIIKNYIGGFHFPYDKVADIYPEDLRTFDELCEYVKLLPELTLYTGHCTGLGAFEFLHEKLGDKIQRIQTGMDFTL